MSTFVQWAGSLTQAKESTRSGVMSTFVQWAGS